MIELARVLRVARVSFALLIPTARAHSQAPPDLDQFVAAVIREFEVPGVAVAIVKDGQIAVAKGYGVRSLAGREPVDEHTRFGIASNTKLFTATAIAMLEERGKLALDSPVIRYLPWFLMSDSSVTRQITVRDLLVHRSGLGLGAGDLLWWPQTTYYRSDLVRRLRFVPLATPFRQDYAYDNVLYTVAGEVIKATSGDGPNSFRQWEDVVSHDILRRVGMTDANVLHSAAAGPGNVARTHARVDGVVKQVSPMTGDNTNPAGGINASATDMAKWLIVQLDSGRLADGSRLYQPPTARELWTLVTPIPLADRSITNGYALGIGVQDYRRTRILLHTGSLPGYASRVLMIPSLRVGIAVLTNQESAEAHDAIAFHIADYFLGARDVDQLKAYLAVAKRNAEDAAAVESKAVVSRDSTRLPSLPLAGYVGRYTDKWYGDVVITQDSGQLSIKFSRTPALVGRLDHWEGDTFVARWNDRTLRADAFVTFNQAKDKTVARVSMKAVSPLTDFSYDFQDLDLRPKVVRPPGYVAELTEAVRFAWTYPIDRTEGYARRIHGFGGMWVDSVSTHVNLLHLRDSTFARGVLWQYPRIVFHQGKYDFIQLNIWQHAIAREFITANPEAGISHGIGQKQNRIHIEVYSQESKEEILRIVRRLRIPLDAIDLDIGEQPRLL